MVASQRLHHTRADQEPADVKDRPEEQRDPQHHRHGGGGFLDWLTRAMKAYAARLAPG
jgi:hypothetical protein